MAGTGYRIRLDHIVYEPKGGGLFSLGEAYRAVKGCGFSAILRADGTEIAGHKGFASFAIRRPVRSAVSA